MTEAFFSGYCAVLNGARTVLSEKDEGADCNYPDCPFVGECPVARELKEFFE